MTTKLDRIGLRAKREPGAIYNNVGHILDIELLREQFEQLDGNKAVGIDKVSKAQYGERLDENLSNLLKQIRKGSYRPKAARLVEIPKPDGSKRPLAIACIEDKIVQSATKAILESIYEPLFLNCSYGFRPGRSCHDALRALMTHTNQNPNGAIVEIDIKRYFNSIPIEKMMALLEMKVKDKRFMQLIKTLMQTPTLDGDKAVPNLRGCPQGSILSPLLANVYLHYAIDGWIMGKVRQNIRGRVEEIRYADDMIFVFEHMDDAKRFYRVLPKRLERFGLQLHKDKSQLLASGRYAAARAERDGKKLGTYQFLGFTCYWGKARKGFYRLKYTSRRDRFTEKLHDLRNYLWRRRNTADTKGTLKQVNRVVKGWINYHGISDNKKRVKAFIEKVKRTLFRWFNRKGGKKRMTWNKFVKVLKYADYPERWRTISMFENKPKQAQASCAIGSRMR